MELRRTPREFYNSNHCICANRLLCVLCWRQMPGIAELQSKWTNLYCTIGMYVFSISSYHDLLFRQVVPRYHLQSINHIYLGRAHCTTGRHDESTDRLVYDSPFRNVIAIFIGAFATQYHFVERIWHPVSYLSFAVSGAAFLVEAAPPAYRNSFSMFPWWWYWVPARWIFWESISSTLRYWLCLHSLPRLNISWIMAD